MQAVVFRNPGDPSVLELADVPQPEPGPQELLVRNFATALNRADLLQRRGLYPPPHGASDILGLEFAGEVAEVGTSVGGFTRGDRVFGLVAGGAYAEFLTVDHRLAVPIPDNLSFDAAAAVPEAFLVANDAMFDLGRLQRGDSVLVHAAASGVGTAVLQLAKARDIRAVATAGTPKKIARCLELGAVRAVHYRDEDFVAAAREATEGAGVHAVIDLVGASHFERNLRSLRTLGRLVVVGLVGGHKVEADLGVLLRKRLTVIGTVLRGRSLEEKIAVTGSFVQNVLPLLQDGTVQPVVDCVFPLEDVRQAHERMEANLNTGKIILRM